MSNSMPYIEVPNELLPILGESKEGLRMYHRDGEKAEMAAWFEVVNELAGQVVSPGGVSMFAPVSRAAVHKRLKEGRLSAFCFHVRRTQKGFFGKTKTIRETPFVYIPVSECKAWAEELRERMLRLGQITREELEGEVPDWTNEMWAWNESKRAKQDEVD